MLMSARNTNNKVSLIPTGIAADCKTTLDAFNADSSVSSCIQPLIDATASFSPLSTVDLKSSDIDWSLTSICKSGAGCSDATIRQWISRVSSACGAELTGSSPNAQVRELYDLLYIVQPLKGAVCSIDSANQKYCVNQVRDAAAASASASGSASASASGSATGSASGSSSASGTASATDSAASASASGNATTNALFASYAAELPYPARVAAENFYIVINSAADWVRRALVTERQASTAQSQSGFATVIAPNVTTYRNTNLPFLFLQPSMASTELCTPCTREIMVSYIKWETQVPYALGLSQSPTLGGQLDLWTAINSTCGANYVNAINSQVQQYVGNTNSTSAAFAQAGMPVGSASGALVFSAIVAGAIALVA